MNFTRDFCELLSFFEEGKIVLSSQKGLEEKVFQSIPLSEQPTRGNMANFKCLYSPTLSEIGQVMSINVKDLQEYNLENILQRPFGKEGQFFIATGDGDKHYRLTAKRNMYVGSLLTTETDRDNHVVFKTVDGKDPRTSYSDFSVDIRYFIPAHFSNKEQYFWRGEVEPYYLYTKTDYDENIVSNCVHPVFLARGKEREPIAILYKGRAYGIENFSEDVELAPRLD